MIFCNLAELMANKNVNISTVARQTGISRTTLTALRYNMFRGIQVETLDALCKYFDIKPDKLLLFSKYGIEIKTRVDDYDVEREPTHATATIEFIISTGTVVIECETCCNLYFSWYNANVSISADIDYFEPEVNPEDDELYEQNAMLKKVLKSLESGIINYYEEEIKRLLINELDLDNWNGEIDFTGGSLSNLT